MFKSLMATAFIIILSSSAYAITGKLLNCSTAYDGSVEITVTDATGPRNFRIPKTKIDVDPILEFIWPYFESASPDQRKVLGIETKTSGTFLGGTISGIQRNLTGLVLIFIGDRSTYSVAIPLGDITKISFPYEPKNASGRSPITRILESVGLEAKR